MAYDHDTVGKSTRGRKTNVSKGKSDCRPHSISVNDIDWGPYLEICQAEGTTYNKDIVEFIKERVRTHNTLPNIEKIEARIMAQLEEIQVSKKKAIEDEQNRPKPSISYEEAIDRAAILLASPENRADYLGMLEPNAKKLSNTYPGHHKNSIKNELRNRVEAILNEVISRRRPQ